MRRKGGRAGLPARVSGRHVVRGRQSSPTLEVRLGEQARLVKTVNIQVWWAAAQPGQDRRFPGVVTHPRPWRAPAQTGVAIQVNFTLTSGSLSTGSPAGRTRTLKRCLREADGPVKLVVVRPHTDGKVFALGCASKPDGESREEPEENKRECRDGLARITLEELAITHSVKDGILPNACSTRTRMVAVLGKSALMRIARLMNNHQSKISSLTIYRRKSSIFFDTIRSYIENEMEQFNFTRLNS